MPDGDKVHAGLSQKYQKVYQQVCEGYLSDEELSYEISQPLVKDVQQYGDAPIRLVEQVAAQLEQLPTGPIFNDADFWKQMSQEIDKIAQRQAYGYNRRGLDLAVEGSKEILLDLRSGKYPHNLRQAMIHNYVRKVYSANFEERISLSKQHYNSVSQATLDERLESMRPHIERRIVTLSKQIARKSSVNSLNPPSHKGSKQPIGLHDNLLPT